MSNFRGWMKIKTKIVKKTKKKFKGKKKVNQNSHRSIKLKNNQPRVRRVRLLMRT